MCSLMIKKCSVKYDRHHHTTTSLLWHNNDCWKWSENSGTKTGGKLWDGNKIQECRGESDSGTMMGMCLRSFLPTVSDSQLVTRDGWWRREDRGGEWGGSVHTVLYSVHGQYRPVSAVLFSQSVATMLVMDTELEPGSSPQSKHSSSHQRHSSSSSSLLSVLTSSLVTLLVICSLPQLCSSHQCSHHYPRDHQVRNYLHCLQQ